MKRTAKPTPRKASRKTSQPVFVPLDAVKELLEAYATRTEKVVEARLKEHEQREDANLKHLIDQLVMTGRSFDAIDAKRAQERKEIEAKLAAIQARVDALEKSHVTSDDNIRNIRSILDPLKEVIEVFRRNHGL